MYVLSRYWLTVSTFFLVSNIISLDWEHFLNFSSAYKERQSHVWLTEDAQDKGSQQERSWAPSSHVYAWLWSLSEWWNQHCSPLLRAHGNPEKFCCSCVLLTLKNGRNSLSNSMFIINEPIRTLNLFFKLCLSWELELDEVNLLNRVKNLFFPGEWNFVTTSCS